MRVVLFLKQKLKKGDALVQDIEQSNDRYLQNIQAHVYHMGTCSAELSGLCIVPQCSCMVAEIPIKVTKLIVSHLPQAHD